jgi:UDP-glucose 4-epimerase
MKILITGGAGFIGSNLTEELVRLGHEVTVMDNFFLGSKQNLKAVINDITLIESDIRNREAVDKAMRGIDYVFHEAAASSAPMYNNDPREAFDSTVRGFINVLQAAKEHSVKKVIYASSSSLYSRLPPPHREDMHIIPDSFYTVAKFTKEHLAQQYTREHNVDTIGLRYFSIYGPHEKAKGRFANIISQFLWKMQKDEVPVIYGDGSQTRDFTYVKDVVRANLLCMKKGRPGDVFNIGFGKAFSFNDVVEILNKHLGKNIKAKHIENPIKNYVQHTLADTSKAERVLGFKAKYTLDDGIKELVEQ